MMKKADVSTFDLPAETRATPMSQPMLIVFVWAATLLVSALPAILSQELHIFPSLPMLYIRVVLLLGFIALGFIWKPTRLLRSYFIIFLVLYLADAAINWVSTLPEWQRLTASVSPGFTREMLSSQVLRLGAAGIMIVTVWLLRPKWGRFLLSKGKLDATAEPVRWLGMDRPMSWKRFGLILSVCITLGTLAFLLLSGSPSGNPFAQLLPLLPVVLLISTMNAFSEEITYRASLLAPLYTAVGKQQALLLTAALFGLWHYYGVPYGVVGVLMAGALGWLLGKSMLETKGVFWAWFIHFWQDVAIFSFIAIHSIVPGG